MGKTSKRKLNIIFISSLSSSTSEEEEAFSAGGASCTAFQRIEDQTNCSQDLILN